MHALQPCNPASRVHFCSWFLQPVVKGEIDPQLTFFSDEAWFHLQEYINTQNNRYWSSQKPHLTHEVLLHPVKVDVWCAVSARRIVGPVLLTKKIIKRRRKTLQLLLERLSHCPHCTYIYARLCPMSLGTELTAVVFGQRVHPILVLVIFFFLELFEGKRLQQ
jgi:hypothetical protein